MKLHPDAFLLAALRDAMAYHPDVFVFSGDLVHEGNGDDYAYFFNMVKAITLPTPTVFALGNHDIKTEFRATLCAQAGGRDERAVFPTAKRMTPPYGLPYTAIQEIGGYRFVSIDTAIEKSPHGSLDADQQSWLRDTLTTPAEKGTILVGHHPMRSRQQWYDVDFADLLEDPSPTTDIFLYLCGHTHFGEVRQIGSVLQGASKPSPTASKR